MNTVLSAEEIGQGRQQVFEVKRYEPEVRPVGKKVPHGYVVSNVSKAAVAAIKKIHTAYDAKREALKRQMMAEYRSFIHQGVPPHEAKKMVMLKLRSALAAYRNAEIEDRQAAILRAKQLRKEVVQRMAPHEQPKHPLYEYATWREAPAEYEPARYRKGPEERKRPPIWTAISTPHSQMEIGQYRPYEGAYGPYGEEVYPRGWPHDPYLLEREIERAAMAGYNIKGLGTWVEEELLREHGRDPAGFGDPGASGLGAFETIFLV